MSRGRGCACSRPGSCWWPCNAGASKPPGPGRHLLQAVPRRQRRQQRARAPAQRGRLPQRRGARRRRAAAAAPPLAAAGGAHRGGDALTQGARRAFAGPRRAPPPPSPAARSKAHPRVRVLHLPPTPPWWALWGRRTARAPSKALPKGALALLKAALVLQKEAPAPRVKQKGALAPQKVALDHLAARKAARSHRVGRVPPPNRLRPFVSSPPRASGMNRCLRMRRSIPLQAK